MKIKLLESCLILASVMGCASPIVPIDITDRKVIDMPAPNLVHTRDIGEILVAKGIRTTAKALNVVKFTPFGRAHGAAEFASCAVSVHPATQFYKGRWETSDEIADCYGPFVIQNTLPDGTTGFSCNHYGVADVCQDQLTNDFFVAWKQFKFPLKQDSGNLAIVENVIPSQTNFAQELIYNGRSGDTLKFIYRELANDMVTAAFTQDVQYDFSQSSEISFKNAKLEVLEATNTSITYKMLSNF